MRIYITDADRPLEENFEETEQRFLEAFADEEVDFREADILPGASLTALLAEYREVFYVGIPVTLLFAGKRIEENLEAWGKLLKRLVDLYQRLRSKFSRNRVTVDNHSAALIAFDYVLERYESTGFRLLRVLGINGLGADVLDCRDEAVDERMVGTYMSYLCIFELDDLLYLEVLVDSSGEILRADPLVKEHTRAQVQH